MHNVGIMFNTKDSSFVLIFECLLNPLFGVL